VLERCTSTISKISGRLGFIVPVSSVSTEGYSALQDIVFKFDGHFSSFDDRPARLFEGLEHIQLTIHLLKKVKSEIPKIFSTECFRWSAAERDSLFFKVQYQPVTTSYLSSCIPKVSKDAESSILKKIWADKRGIGEQKTSVGEHVTFYSRKVHNFLQALDFVPEVFDGNGNLRPPSELKELVFTEKAYADISFCLLNSTLFRWFINVFSDCRHVNKREVDGYRLDLTKAASENKLLWNKLAKELSKSLRSTSEYRQMRFRHDNLKVQCIIPKHSKPIIDEIDRMLARHYGFTDEELDFIINYDIKYRMGREE
jgi:hypothetical protein